VNFSVQLCDSNECMPAVLFLSYIDSPAGVSLVRLLGLTNVIICSHRCNPKGRRRVAGRSKATRRVAGE